MQIVYLQCLRIFLQSPPEKVTQAVNCAIEAGYRHIDGAYVYGNEVNIAPALKEQMSKGQVKREDLFITSKVSEPNIFPVYICHSNQLSKRMNSNKEQLVSIFKYI